MNSKLGFYNVFNVDGLNVLHFPTPHNIILLQFVVNAGAADETPEMYGAAHYLEHMFFKGTNKKNYEQVNKELAILGEANAYTNYTKTVYHLCSLNTNFKQAMNLLAEMLFDASLPSNEFEKEKNVIVEERQTTLDDPDRHFWNTLYHKTFGDIAHPIIGNEQTLHGMSLEHLKAFKNKFYTKNNMCCIISGNVTENEIKTVLQQITQQYPIPEGTRITRSPIQINTEHHSFQHPSQQAMFSISFPASSYDTLDLQTRITTDILHDIVGGGMYSILFNTIREKMGLCYGIWMIEDMVYPTRRTSIFTQMNKENIETAKTAIFAELNKIKSGELPDDLITVAKANNLFNRALGFQTATSIGHKGTAFFERREIYTFEEQAKSIEQVKKADLIEQLNLLTDKEPTFCCMNG